MRRLLTAMFLLAALAGCGRSGPNTKPGGATFEVEMPPAGAGAINLTIGDAIAGTCPQDCGPFEFQPGATVSLVAVEDDGDFGEWTGSAAACGTSPTCGYVADGDQLVGALFTARVTVVTSGGSIASTPAGIDCPATTCTGDFAYGSIVELAPNGGELLASWAGDCADDLDRRCQLEVSGDRTAVAVFGTTRVDLFGTVADEYAEAVAADPLVPGGYVLAGSHEANMVLGDEFVGATAGQDLFLARFDGDGVATWTTTVAGGGDVRPHALALSVEDDELACFVGGSFTGAVEPGGVAAVDPVGALNGFLGKYRPGEALPLWWHPFTGAAGDNASVVTDLDVLGGRVAMSGVQSGQVTLPGAAPKTVGGGNQGNRKHGLSAIWDSAGNLQYAVHHGRNSGSHAEANAVLLYSTGGVFVAGGRDDTVNDSAGFGGPCAEATNPATIDGWLFSMSNDFTACGVNAIVPLRTAGSDLYSALAASPDAFFSAGYSRTDMERGPALATFDAAGTEIWRQDWIATVDSGAWTGAWDGVHGEWVVAGSFAGTIAIAGTDYVSAGGFDVIVAWLDAATGDPLQVVQLGGTGDDVAGGPVLPGAALGNAALHHGYAASALSILPSGAAVLAGYTTSAELGGRANAGGASGTSDLFVAHLLRAP